MRLTVLVLSLLAFFSLFSVMNLWNSSASLFPLLSLYIGRSIFLYWSLTDLLHYND